MALITSVRGYVPEAICTSPFQVPTRTFAGSADWARAPDELATTIASTAAPMRPRIARSFPHPVTARQVLPIPPSRRARSISGCLPEDSTLLAAEGEGGRAVGANRKSGARTAFVVHQHEGASPHLVLHHVLGVGLRIIVALWLAHRPEHEQEAERDGCGESPPPDHSDDAPSPETALQPVEARGQHFHCLIGHTLSFHAASSRASRPTSAAGAEPLRRALTPGHLGDRETRRATDGRAGA